MCNPCIINVGRWIVLSGLSLLTCFSRAEEISVAAAISLKPSLEAIRPDYETRSGDTLKFTFASSGQLAAQVQSGAPVDLFLSAARKQVDDLQQTGNADQQTSIVFAGNELVMIVPSQSKGSVKGFESLADAAVHRLAIGEPTTVPAGEYAQQVLEHFKLIDKLKGRLVYGLSVQQVLQYVQDGEVDAGIVYQSDAKQAGDGVKVIEIAKAQWHQPIQYWGVVIRDCKQPKGAQKLLDFLRTEPAQRVLQANGFIKPATASAN